MPEPEAVEAEVNIEDVPNIVEDTGLWKRVYNLLRAVVKLARRPLGLDPRSAPGGLRLLADILLQMLLELAEYLESVLTAKCFYM